MPYLTCDDVSEVESFDMELDGVVTLNSPASKGHAWIDITSIPVGKHIFRLRSKNAWGVSEWSAPLESTKSLPGVPVGLKLALEMAAGIGIVEG